MSTVNYVFFKKQTLSLVHFVRISLCEQLQDFFEILFLFNNKEKTGKHCALNVALWHGGHLVQISFGVKQMPRIMQEDSANSCGG